MDSEVLRESYRPSIIKLLLVGESAPAEGRFFYDTCAMTTYTSRAFERHFDIKFRDNSEFLGFFKQHGCFLDDLSHTPVDKLVPKEREALLLSEIGGLSKRLRDWNPSAVCIVLKKIQGHVVNAIDLAEISPLVRTLPFPGNGHQNKYISGLSDVLGEVFGEDK